LDTLSEFIYVYFMKNLIIRLCLLVGLGASLQAQNFGTVKGRVSETNTGSPLKTVLIKVKNTNQSTLTNKVGEFILTKVPIGNQILILSLNGFEPQQYPVVIKPGETVDLGSIMLYVAITSQDQDGLISLTDNDLSEDGNGGSENTSGLLQASRDAFLNVAAFQFGQARFRVRGYDSNNGTILINGVEMNKFYDGRPQWSNWGGLNDVMRNRDFKEGLSPQSVCFWRSSWDN